MKIKAIILFSVGLNIVLFFLFLNSTDLFFQDIQSLSDPRLIVVGRIEGEVVGCVDKAISRFSPPAVFTSIKPGGGAQQRFYVEEINGREADEVAESLKTLFGRELPVRLGLSVEKSNAMNAVDPCKWSIALNGQETRIEIIMLSFKGDNDLSRLLVIVSETLDRKRGP